MTSKNKLSSVSAGVAQGILVNKETIERDIPKNQTIILQTEMLSPGLTKYFDKISGIVSNNGGLLSHLAIIAREKNIPVLVGFTLENSKIKIGDNIQLDASQAKISILE